MALAMGLFIGIAPDARAQVTTRTREDSLRAAADSAARRDSIEAEDRRIIDRQRRLADTIKAPTAAAETPLATGIGEPRQWDRDGIFATGALTLGELLDAVPGVTGYRGGWIGSPYLPAYFGAFGRVRVFYDGVELVGLDARNAGLLDLSFVDTWQLEDARVEQGANELRVYLRSWRVRSITPVTRVDIHTGDLETNSYRGYFGRRFPRGEVLQLGAYQYSSTDVAHGADASNTSLWARVGWARGKWSIDASLLRANRDRLATTLEEPQTGSLAALSGVSSTSYARAAYGDPESGIWLQAMASSQRFRIRGPTSTIVDSIPGSGGGGPGGSPDAPDTLTIKNDTTRTEPQYLLTGGWSAGALRLSASGRVRKGVGKTFVSQGARAELTWPRLAASAFIERSPAENLMRIDASARAMLLPRVAVSGAASRFAPLTASTSSPTTLAIRGELGLRLGRVWLSGGVMQRDTANLVAPVVFDTLFRPGGQGALTGYTAAVRGKFYRDIGIDAWAVRYSDAGLYRPQYQTLARLYLDSDMRTRYPSGNLHILIALTHEYRTQALFPRGPTTVLRSSQYRTWGAELEIRLLAATLSYQYRNFFIEEYQQVPGFALPRAMNYYGVRWNFFN